MKKNRIIILFALILVLITAALYLTKSSGTFKDRDKNFAVKDTASITKIFLADKKNRTILLERKSPGEWELNGNYLARQSGVELLLETMKNLVPKYPVPKNAHNNIVSQMAAYSTKVEVYQLVYRINLFDKIKLFQHEKLTKTYYVGTATSDNMGTFMLLEGADVPFVVHLLGLRGYVAPRYSTIEKEWRDHSIFKTKLYDISEIIMEIPREPENSFRIANGENEILFYPNNSEQAMPFDTLKMLNFLTAFADIRFEELMNERMPQELQDSISGSMAKNIITVSDKTGKSTNIRTFYKANTEGSFDPLGNVYPYDIDRLYAVVNEERDFVLIQYYHFDKILRPASYFIID